MFRKNIVCFAVTLLYLVSAAGYAAGASNTFLGGGAGTGGSFNDTTYIGAFAGNANPGNANTFIGSGAGEGAVTGSGNIFIGFLAGFGASVSNKLYITNENTPFPLIDGDFSTRELTVNGALIVATPVIAISDERYKKNIQPLDAALEKIMRLNGVSYDWRTDEFAGRGFTRDKQIGFIGQNVEKVLPEIVQTDSRGYKAVSYEKVIPVLVEAMKEQQTRIQGQQKELKEKETEIQALKDAVRDVLSRVTVLESSGKTLAAK
ncbi:MAG: hypothetical protein C0402_04305 [Thermodesulfovibrio sp.]|nr:hypothetical protein [Thermodesulfovibrio sp.]